jgi:hypothetical protein
MSRSLIAGHAGFHLNDYSHWIQDVCEVDELAHRPNHKNGISAVVGGIGKAPLGYPSGKGLANAGRGQTGRKARLANREVAEFKVCYKVNLASIMPKSHSLNWQPL